VAAKELVLFHGLKRTLREGESREENSRGEEVGGLTRQREGLSREREELTRREE